MSWVLIILVVVAICIDILLIVLFHFNFKKYQSPLLDELPMVSVLLPAKDEERNISRCLDSLLALSYPVDRLEILVGNDNSSDRTLEIAQTYSVVHNQIKVCDIKGKLGKQQGKGNALAYLARQASGEFYLFTDADMILPTDWVQHMIQGMKKNVGVAIGVTRVHQNEMQNTDWLTALAMVKVMTDLGRPVTGVGNNMMISREAYESVGGYESMPFSIVEDFELFRQVHKKGFRCEHVFSEGSLGTTLPMKGFANLLNQRKRWTRGATQLSWKMLVLLALQPAVYLGIAILLFLNPIFGVIFLSIKILSKVVFNSLIRVRLKQPQTFIGSIIFEFYNLGFTLVSLLYYLTPTSVTWKGRKY